jgi:hypothetical protein
MWYPLVIRSVYISSCVITLYMNVTKMLIICSRGIPPLNGDLEIDTFET